MTPDNELLDRYARTGSEDAFAELVRRYVNLVYSAALRQVGGDAHLAQDVAQTVFADLARKAAPLSRRPSLSGWLYTSAHFAAAKITRTDQRRRQREEKFMREPIHENMPGADWEKLRPVLDAVMHELKESDREAVLLRYFENRSFAELGAKLRLNENTARMRVERALEKLRTLLAKRGITMGAALATVISANAVQTAPGYLAGSLVTGSLAAAGAKTFGLLKFMTATNLKLGLGALAIAGVAAAFVMQHQAQTALRAENQSLTQQLAQLKIDNADLSNRAASSSNAQAVADGQLAELLKLRAEVTRLRTQKDPPAPTTATETNDLPQAKKLEVILEAKFVSAPVGDIGEFESGWAPVGDNASVLSADQLTAVNKALQDHRANLICANRIRTSSGVEGILDQTSRAVVVNGTNAVAGVHLDILPFFSADSSVFTLNVGARLNQLTGDPAQPGIRTTEVSNHLTLFPGQTMALKAGLPSDGWLPDSPVSEVSKDLLVFITPKLVEAKQKTAAPREGPSTDAARQKINSARHAALALLMFADQNQNRFPTDLAEASRYVNGDYSMEGIQTNFSYLNPGSSTNITNPTMTILIKENEPWQGEDGKWHKAYAFADGHAEIHSEPTGNFDDYEKSRIVPAPTQ